MLQQAQKKFTGMRTHQKQRLYLVGRPKKYLQKIIKEYSSDPMNLFAIYSEFTENYPTDYEPIF